MTRLGSLLRAGLAIDVPWSFMRYIAFVNGIGCERELLQ